MPLSQKQRDIVTKGCEACQVWADACARMRLLGFPDEAMEERCMATQKTYDAAKSIVNEHDRQHGGKANGTG